MTGNNRRMLILTSAVILLPIIFGLLMWERLPDTMLIHWGADGNPDGRSGKVFAVFGIPLFLLVIHWSMILLDRAVSRNEEKNEKAYRVILWITPLISLGTNAFLYTASLGWKMRPGGIIAPMLGVMFILIGNYLPKVRRNRTLGIKISWTLKSDENWNRTHRLAGKLWVAGGILYIAAGLLPFGTAIFVWTILLLLMVAVPLIYSYYLHRTLGNAADQSGETPDAPAAGFSKKSGTAALALTLLLLVNVLVLMFVGEIDVRYDADSFTVKATYWDDFTVGYDEIDRIEYRKEGVDGIRVSGFGSPRLSMGNYSNDEFGDYTRFTCSGSTSAVVLTSGKRVLVLSGKNDAKTREIHERLSAEITETD